MRLIFSSHQVDLLLRNTSFIYTSNVLSSLIISSTVQYMMFIFVSKFLEILHFDEHNITKFLERFEEQCDEYEVIEKKRWIKLFRYCVRFIVEFIKIFLHMSIEVEKLLKRRCKKSIKIKISNRWLTRISF